MYIERDRARERERDIYIPDKSCQPQIISNLGAGLVAFPICLGRCIYVPPRLPICYVLNGIAARRGHNGDASPTGLLRQHSSSLTVRDFYASTPRSQHRKIPKIRKMIPASDPKQFSLLEYIYIYIYTYLYCIKSIINDSHTT